MTRQYFCLGEGGMWQEGRKLLHTFGVTCCCLVTWEYWQLVEAESNPNLCKLTLLQLSLSLSGVPHFSQSNSQGPEVNTHYFRKQSQLQGHAFTNTTLLVSAWSVSSLLPQRNGTRICHLSNSVLQLFLATLLYNSVLKLNKFYLKQGFKKLTLTTQLKRLKTN